MKYPAFYQKRPLVVCALCFGAGILFAIREILPLSCSIAGAGLCCICLTFFHFKKLNKRFAAFALSFFIGFLYTSFRTPAVVPSGAYSLEGTVQGDLVLRENDGSLRGYLRDITAMDEDGSVYSIAKAYWTFYPNENDEEGCMFFDGDTLRFDGKIYLPNGQMNPYGFNFREYLSQQGVFTGISGSGQIEVIKQNNVNFSGFMLRVRRKISSHLDHVFGSDADLPKALLLGEKNTVPDETKNTLENLGIAHILTVSGLHVGLLGAALIWITRPLRPSPRGKTIIIGVFLFLYCALLNFSSSVVRASVLLLLYSLARTFKRSQDPLTFLAAAFITVLIINPYSLTSVGFQMTFGAVLGITLVSGSFQSRLALAQADSLLIRALKKTGRGLTAYFGASLGISVPLINTYYRISLLSILTNPVATAGMQILLPVYCAIALLGLLFIPAGQFLSQILGKSIGFFFSVLDRLADWKYASVCIPSVSFFVICAIIVCLILCSRYILLDRKKRWMGLCLAIVLAVTGTILHKDRSIVYTQLYVGQADCEIIEDGSFTVVVDTGSSGGDLADYLLARGKKIDILILTHLHVDHFGGVYALLDDEIPIGEVWLPIGAENQKIDSSASDMLDRIHAKGISVRHVSLGDTLMLPRGKMTILWPQYERAEQSANDQSLVCLAELEGVRILLTGDMTSTYEAYSAMDADILKVAHHGSAQSTLTEYLNIVSPDIALISCASNRLLPAQNTLDRLSESGVQVYRTDQCGAVQIRIQGKAFTVKSHIRGMQSDE